MRIFNSVLAVCAALLIFVQCAEKGTENYDEREQAVFDHWMQTNHPGLERLDNGMYIEWLRRGTGDKLAENNYMYVDYRGYDLNGNLFSNRDSVTAVREGTFTRYTHYTDHYAIYNNTAYYFTRGEYDALALMKQGDSVRIYMPSMLAYGTTNSTFIETDVHYGYEGWYNCTTNPKNYIGSTSSMPKMNGRPVVIELALNDIVTDAPARELSRVKAVGSALGYATSDQDTIRKGLFFRYVDDPDSDVSGEDVDAGVITEDSTVYVVYALRFLDDFLVGTNDAATAYNDWGDFWNTYAPTSFKASSSTLLTNFSALNELIKSDKVKVRYNSRMQIIFISDWGYGYYGDAATSSKPVIYPYTPLKMDIITMPYGYDPSADEDAEE